MTSRWVQIVAILVLLISIVALGVSGTRWRAVSQERERAVAELASVRQQATEIGRLRRTLGTQRVATAGSRADALAEIADTLAAAGLPDGAMRSLDEQGEAEVGETGLRRQTLRLALAALTPSELGRFFARLGVDRPQWIVIRIELNRPRREDGNRYDAQLILARTYAPQGQDLGEERP